MNVLNLSAAYAVIFGAYIAWPWTDLFTTGTSLYSPMTEIVSNEAFWGGLMMAAGLTSAIAGWLGYEWPRLVMFVTYTLFSLLFFIGDVQRPGGALFFVMALWNLVQYRAVKWTKTTRSLGLAL